jgi:hypothetical protein
VQRARYEADRAERAFSNVEPENRLVARTLESRWEVKLTALAEAESALATARKVKPPVPDHDALRALAADLPRLWDAPTTSPRDRKRLLRMLIADVTLLLEPDFDTVRIGVRWHTGAADELVVERRGPGRTPPEALEIIRKYGATHSNLDIAKILNDAGLRTGKNLRFTPRHVAGVRGIYKIFTARTMAVQDGEISVKQAASLLGIPADAIYNWLRHGQVPALVRGALVHPLGSRNPRGLPAERSADRFASACFDTRYEVNSRFQSGITVLIKMRDRTARCNPHLKILAGSGRDGYRCRVLIELGRYEVDSIPDTRTTTVRS